LYGDKINLTNSVRQGFVSGIAVCKASKHVTQHLKEFIFKETKAVYADKLYVGHRKYLQEEKNRDGIQAKAVRGKELNKLDIGHNQRIAKKRRFIEGVFGSWKQWYDWHKTKSLGLTKDFFSTPSLYPGPVVAIFRV